MNRYCSPHLFVSALVTAAVPATTALAVEPAASPVSTVTAPSKVTKAQLRKGIAVKVTCNPDCTARLQLSGPIGIIASQSAPVSATTPRVVRLKAAAFQLNALKRGATLYVQLEALREGAAPAHARKKLRLR
jgi:hypothetical protein